MSNVLRLDYASGTVKQDLARLPEIMRKAGLEALNEAAEFMVTMARGYCLVDTGSLQRSIRKEQRDNIISVTAGQGGIINPKTRRVVDYAVYVEERNPFMRPAWETVRGFIADKIRAKVLEAVNK